MSMQDDLETLIWFGQTAGRSVEEIAAGIIRIGWRPPASEAEPDRRLEQHDQEVPAKARQEATELWTEYYVHEAGKPVLVEASGTRARSLVVSLLKWARAANPNKKFVLMSRTVTATPWEQVTDDEL